MDLDSFEKRVNRILPHLDTIERLGTLMPEIEEMLGVFKRMKEERAGYDARRAVEDQDSGEGDESKGELVDDSGADGANETVGGPGFGSPGGPGAPGDGSTTEHSISVSETTTQTTTTQNLGTTENPAPPQS